MTQQRIYQCAHPYHITFNVLNREWFFDDEKNAGLLHEIILNAGVIKNHIIYQFCIMPDHVHILCKTEPIIEGFCHRTLGFQPRTLENVLCRKPGESDNQIMHTACNCGMIHEYDVSDFIKSIKGTFSRYIHIGDLWQKRFRDEIIHTGKQLYSTINYITNNPVKAELSEKWSKRPYQYKNDELIEQLFK